MEKISIARGHAVLRFPFSAQINRKYVTMGKGLLSWEHYAGREYPAWSLSGEIIDKEQIKRLYKCETVCLTPGML